MPKKKKTRRRHTKHTSFLFMFMKNRGFEKMTLVIIVSLIFLGAAGAGQAILQSQNTTSTPLQTQPQPTKPFPTVDTTATNKQLQLNSFQITNTPPPEPQTPIVTQPQAHPTFKPSCGIDNGQPMTPDCTCDAYTVTCRGGQCVEFYEDPQMGPLPPNNCSEVTWCQDGHAPSGDGKYCLGKPIIYLYPETDTLVSVSIQTPGSIVISDPLYPPYGWKNILAHPNGKFEYDNQTYHELYYETSVQDVASPKQGILIPTSHLSNSLKTITTKLGLNEFEQQEFLDYWVPKLQKLHSPYILFSLLTPQEKNRVDHVEITPAPQTRIEFIAYFKPLEKPIAVETLLLPETIPQRNGFTIVEWGGTIDTNTSIF